MSEHDGSLKHRELRDYQARSVEAVKTAWQRHQSVCLVGPTGCGKTRISWEIVQDLHDTLYVIHRTDLRRQITRALRHLFDVQLGPGAGRDMVAVLLPGRKRVRAAPITVASIQTLLQPSVARLLAGRKWKHGVVDEAHHYRADHWQQVRELYLLHANLLGLTAYPERRDGRGLRYMFDELVVAANYSELVHRGHLVRCRVYRPTENLGRDLAMDPVTAWLRYSEGSKSFAFVPRIDKAIALANAFRKRGIPADVVTANDTEAERIAAIASFRDPNGSKILVSVDALVEGIDEPQMRCVLLARPFRFEGAYVQVVGRPLRPYAGKRDAILIDLVGSSAIHGNPTEDREYNLGAVRDPKGRKNDVEPDDDDEKPERVHVEPRVLNRELVLVDRGALKPNETVAPVPTAAALPELTRLPQPGVSRASGPEELFRRELERSKGVAT